MSNKKCSDDFDFEQEEQVHKKKPQLDNKIKNKELDDFFQDDGFAHRLPAIGKRCRDEDVGEKGKHWNEKEKYDGRNGKKCRDNVYDDDEDIDEQINCLTKGKKKQNNLITKKQQQTINYYEDIEEISHSSNRNQSDKKNIIKTEELVSTNIAKKSPTQEENRNRGETYQDLYQNDFQAQYDQQQDEKTKKFDTQQQKPRIISNPISTSTAPKTHTSTTTNPFHKKPSPNPAISRPPKPSTITQAASTYQPKRHLTVDKNSGKKYFNIPRTNSRHSFKSVGSRQGSLSMGETGKFTSDIQRTLPDVNLNQFNQDRLNRLNQRVRTMIKKFNDDLNMMVNRNIQKMKQYQNEKPVDIDKQLKIWQERKITNNKRIEFLERDYSKLEGRDGQLREEEYQWMVEKQIDNTKQLIKEKYKVIQKLKIEIKSQGNRLSEKSQDRKLASDLHNLRSKYFQAKKEQDKQLQLITKYSQQITELRQKIQHFTEWSRKKEIADFQKKQSLLRRYQQKKRKLILGRNQQQTIINHWANKIIMITKQKQQQKIDIQACQLEIKNIGYKMQKNVLETKRYIERERERNRSNHKLIQSLEEILVKIEDDTYSVKSDQNGSHSSSGQLENQMMGKSRKMEKRSESANNNKPSNILQPQQKIKPKIPKRKKKNKTVDYKKPNPPSQKWQKLISKQKSQKLEEQQKEEQQLLQQEEKDRNKPFIIKKNGVSGEKLGEQRKIIYEILQKSNKRQDDKKNYQIAKSVPKMIKFKKRGNQQLALLIPKNEQKLIENNSLPQQPPKIQQVLPIFGLKRFNLRNKIQKKQDTYIPTVQKKYQQQQDPPQIQPPTEQYKPKFVFGQVEDYFKKAATENRQQEKMGMGIPDREIVEENKPKINRRVREQKKDRDQPENNYIPSGNIDRKPGATDSHENPSNTITNNNNPYALKQPNPYPPTPKDHTFNLAQKKLENNSNTLILKHQPKTNDSTQNENNIVLNNSNNPYMENHVAGGRVKEGPVRKTKQHSAQKKKCNIYEAVQQIELLQQLGNTPKITQNQPPQSTSIPKDNNLNLNDLLGLKKKSNNDNLVDLLAIDIPPSQQKKHNDFFFSDMDI